MSGRALARVLREEAEDIRDARMYPQPDLGDYDFVDYHAGDTVARILDRIADRLERSS